MKRVFRFSEGRDGAARDVRSEIRFHLEMRAEEFVAQGMTPEEARRAAADAFGDVEAIESEVRSLRSGNERRRRLRDGLRGFGTDVAFALRTLRKNPGFTLSAVAILTLGLGATTSVFTVVNGVLLRPLPYERPESLAMVWLQGSAAEGLAGNLPLSSGFYLDLKAQARCLEGIAGFRSWSYSVAGDGPAEKVEGARVTPSLFGVLGVRPYLGQTFTEAEAAPGGPRVALISWSYWRRRFGGAPSVVGQRVMLSGEPFTIVGVMPKGFAFPRGAELPPGLNFAARTDLWTPFVFSAADTRDHGTLNMAAVARLAPGVTAAAAEAELTAQLHRWSEENGSRQRLDYRLVSLQEQAGGPVRRSLLILMGAVGLVLLIACANVTNLLLARTAARQRELAVRAALGAGRGRIARQLATENIVLALLGTGLGLAFSVGAVRAMLSLVPRSLPRVDDVSVDGRVIALALGAAVVLGLLFGIATAYQVRWTQLAASLHDAAGRATGGLRRRLGRRFLVVLEISLSLVLLIGAAELTMSFLRLQRVEPGFSAERALVADVQMPLANGFDPARDGPRWRAFFAQLLDRLNAAPGIVAAGGVSSMPLTGVEEGSGVRIVGRPAPTTSSGLRTQYFVTAGRYFEAMGIRLAAGRVFDGRDRSDGAPVVIVNREFVRRYLPGASPLGLQIVGNFEFFFSNPPPARTIVGVVDDVRQAARDASPVPQVYVPEDQMPYPSQTLVLRTEGAASIALRPLQTEVKALDPVASVSNVRSLEELLASSLARQRFSATMLGLFAAAAMLLSMVGLYGVIALHVGQRRREIGVRMALGARAGDVLRLVLDEGMRITAVGLVVGVAGALATGQVLRSLVYGSTAGDPAVFAASALGIGLVSLAATYLPARRAARVDPTVSLRAD